MSRFRAGAPPAATIALTLFLGIPPAPGGAAGVPVEEPVEEPAPAEGETAAPPEAAAAAAAVFEHLMVTGGAARAAEVPGSAHLIDRLELRRQDYGDIHRVLLQVPGVNVQEEEGFGLRPNIGMRGTGVDRSQKITLMEDGVPIAPAPYAAPAAYYFPTTGRMESVEVRKGSSSVRQGPLTIGGVVNLVSTSIPPRLGGRLSAAGGEHDTRRLHANLGDSGERVGWLLETYRFDTGGFKRLDGGGETGVELADYLAKLRLAGDGEARFWQTVELKLGRTDQLADETYLGLTGEDFRRAPLRRYAASQQDFLDSEHRQAQLRHFLQGAGRWSLTTTVYRNDFFRNWHKLESVAGVAIGSVLERPGEYADELAVLRGEADASGGALTVRNNRRDYYAQGIETVLGVDLARGRARHRLEVGLRRHRDEEDRFQDEERWNLLGGVMSLAAAGRPGSQSNRVAEAEAWALFATDEISLGRWTLTPGVRVEAIDYTRRDFGGDDPGRSGRDLSVRRNDVREVIPGLGIGYRASPRWLLFAGAHKGFAPPGPGSQPGTRAEESRSYELGFRFAGRRLTGEAVAFFNDYDNLLGRDTLSTGGLGTGELFNGGSVAAAGLETALRYDLGAARGWTTGVPLRLAYTYTTAEFRSSFETAFADWAPRVERGDRLPYLPEHQWSAGLGLTRQRWSAYLDLAYVAAMRTSPGRGPLAADRSTDGHLVPDLSLELDIRSGLRLFARIRNLTDEVYRAALRPAGARPGLPRSALIGVSWEPSR